MDAKPYKYRGPRVHTYKLLQVNEESENSHMLRILLNPKRGDKMCRVPNTQNISLNKLLFSIN